MSNSMDALEVRCLLDFLNGLNGAAEDLSQVGSLGVSDAQLTLHDSNGDPVARVVYEPETNEFQVVVEESNPPF